MEENKQAGPQQEPALAAPYTTAVTPPSRPNPFPSAGKELGFFLAALVCGLLLCNFILFGGFNLGFAIGADLCIVAVAAYLLRSGHKLNGYSGFLLAVSLIIGAGFARSHDGFVKLVMLCFLFVSVNLGLTLLAARPRHNTGSFSTLGDVFYTGFVYSLGYFSPAFSGLKQNLSGKSEGYHKGSAIFKGLLIALPVLLVVIPLLIRSDAAFEGLVNLLPDFRFSEIFATALFGIIACCLLYCQGTSLHHSEKKPLAAKARKGINSLTINTVLVAICLVYVVYLISQLAYFVGGFAGILPAEFTMAEYARRGFFEMAWLCAINLGLIGLCMGFVEKKGSASLLTKLLCLFISLITIFFVAAASGKMFLYIDAYGLTRLRVLTQVIMLWLGLTTILVAIWLFAPKLPYMKTVIATALILGAAVLWGDVDNLVAKHNVDSYLSGSMTTIDVNYLGTLNNAAVPHIARLAQESADEKVRNQARSLLEEQYVHPADDFRDWNYVNHIAQRY